ncbi:hypothetical protein V502_00289 [Pseudogymnoascus sp. VKM F-4520 (FW-2644)]|nr:hypothetical protein V502_00289 [Pseudogymnoascus sp. VKM F-4520 (FW-2644)]
MEIKYSTQDESIIDFIKQAIEEKDAVLHEINRKIHENPELGYEEFKAHDNVASLLESLDYKVTRHAYGIQTALMAEFGSGGRVIAFNAEYDALPDIGHACGHNLIATMSIGAFIALAETLKRYKIQGRVRLLGTPAEEGGGGKLKLIEAGAYSDVDACMMIHPGPEDGCAGYTGDAYMPTLANKKFTVRFTGKAAHASMSPWQGINALDAVVLGYNGVSALRQQIQPAQRIHGVISEGGKRPNIITAHTSLDYYVRSTSLKSADTLMERVVACFKGAAIQTGCEVETELINTYADVRPNKPISTLYADAMDKIGSPVKCDVNSPPVPGSTDQGNVCYECPAFQGYVGIPADPGSYNHTAGFTAAAGAEIAHKLCLEPAKGMAVVGWQILSDESVATQVWKDFDEDSKIRDLDEDIRVPVKGGGCC